MATYTPKTLIGPTALTSSAVTYYTTPGSTVGIGRTIQVSTPSAAKTFTLAIGTDAVGTRIFDAYALTANVPSIFNGWWTSAAAVIWQAKATDTVPILYVGGYEAT